MRIAPFSLSSKASFLLENVCGKNGSIPIAAAQLDKLSVPCGSLPYSYYIPTERLLTFVERGLEITKCAALLFAGYVDGASYFAETHGGGGGSDDQDWGRKN